MLGARASAITARKPTLIRSRKRRELVRRGEVDALIEDIAGTVFSVEPACAVRAGAIESSRALCEGHLGTAERDLPKSSQWRTCALAKRVSQNPDPYHFSDQGLRFKAKPGAQREDRRGAL